MSAKGNPPCKHRRDFWCGVKAKILARDEDMTFPECVDCECRKAPAERRQRNDFDN